MRGLFENKGEGVVKFLVGAKPDIFASPHVDVGLEDVGMGRAHPRVYAVGTNDQVTIAISFEVLHFCFELELNAERTGALLENIQQALATDAAKAMAARAHDHTAVMHGDVVPIDEGGADRGRAYRIVGFQIAKRFLGKYYAPPESVVRPVTFDHDDLIRGIAQFQRNR